MALALITITQGRNERGREHNAPGVKSLWALKTLNNIASILLNTVHLLPQGPRFEQRGAELVFCPGRHLTSARPCYHLLAGVVDNSALKATLHCRCFFFVFFSVNMTDCYLRIYVFDA